MLARTIETPAVLRIDLLRWSIAGAGFSPITALCAAVFGVAALPVAVAALVAPAVVLLIVVLAMSGEHRALALRGFLFGLVAVTAYDAFRLPFMVAGIWHDFIPRIGMWLLGDGRLHPLTGYLYRYLGDGAGMGMTFGVLAPLASPLRLRVVYVGVLYGVAIWACLMATLLIAPQGQAMMFTLTPLSASLSLGGHLIYGATLGYLFRKTLRD